MTTNITDVENYDAVVQSPEDGDFVTGLSVKTLGQSLANRTRWLKKQVDTMVATLISTVHDWTAQQTFKSHVLISAPAQVYLDTGSAIYYIDRPLRTVLVPLVAFRAPGWTPVSGQTTAPALVLLEGAAQAEFLVGRNLLPSGAEVTRVRAAVRTKAPIEIDVTLFSYDTSTPAPNGAGRPLGTADTPATAGGIPNDPTGTNMILTANMSKYVQNDRSVLRIAVDVDADSGTIIYWIEIQFKDPGLKSF